MILKIYYACTCTNMSRTSKSLSMLQGAHERWGPWAEWPIRREELVTVPQKADRNANRQMARAVVCKGGGGSGSWSWRLEDYDLFYLALNEHMIQWKSLSCLLSTSLSLTRSASLISMLNMCVWGGWGCVCVCEGEWADSRQIFTDLSAFRQKMLEVLEGLPSQMFHLSFCLFQCCKALKD